MKKENISKKEKDASVNNEQKTTLNSENHNTMEVSKIIEEIEELSIEKKILVGQANVIYSIASGMEEIINENKDENLSKTKFLDNLIEKIWIESTNFLDYLSDGFWKRYHEIKKELELTNGSN